MDTLPTSPAKHSALVRKLKKQDVYKRQVYILRPCMIHGPGNKGNLNLLYGVAVSYTHLSTFAQHIKVIHDEGFIIKAKIQNPVSP